LQRHSNPILAWIVKARAMAPTSPGMSNRGNSLVGTVAITEYSDTSCPRAKSPDFPAGKMRTCVTKACRFRTK
jgi:hypothetical protein